MANHNKKIPRRKRTEGIAWPWLAGFIALLLSIINLVHEIDLKIIYTVNLYVNVVILVLIMEMWNRMRKHRL